MSASTRGPVDIPPFFYHLDRLSPTTMTRSLQSNKSFRFHCAESEISYSTCFATFWRPFWTTLPHTSIVLFRSSITCFVASVKISFMLFLTKAITASCVGLVYHKYNADRVLTFCRADDPRPDSAFASVYVFSILSSMNGSSRL